MAGRWLLVYVGFMLLCAPVSALHVPGVKRQFIVGFLSAIFNPQNAIFYLPLLTVMVSPETLLGIRILYALWMVVVVLIWDMGVAVAFGRERAKRVLGCWVFRIEKVSGLLLAAFGVLLVVD